MITLINISTKRLISYAKLKSNSSLKFFYIYELLTKNKINNYQALQELLLTKLFQSDSYGVVDYLTMELNKVLDKVKKANEVGTNIEIFEFNNYDIFGLDSNTIKETDQTTKGNILLYKNPISQVEPRDNPTNKATIAEIKEHLGCISDGKLENSFKANFNEIGSKIIPRIVKTIIFYEEQVLRQAEETNLRNINLFTINQSEKQQLTEIEIRDIAEYLIDNAHELIWGKLTDAQKKLIIKSLCDSKNDNLRRIRRDLITIISNYTTLNELKQGVVKRKVLDRFIILNQ